MRERPKVKFYLFLILAFMALNLIFTTFKDQMDAVNRFCFSFTGEFSKRKAVESPVEDASHPADQAKKTNAPKQPLTPKKSSGISSAQLIKAKTLNAPKTQAPKILYKGGEPDFSKDKIPDFPPLRTEVGENWDKEKTRIRMTCDGLKLYVHILCYDSDKDELVVAHSRQEGAASSWKDDSIELFLMKSQDSEAYCQYVASASGLSHVFYLSAGDLPFIFSQQALPAKFTPPEISSNLLPEGFEVKMQIDLSNIGLDRTMHGQKILMQIVRNYRGENVEGVSLQLFPCYIYADLSMTPNNHDRRSFIPVEIQK